MATTKGIGKSFEIQGILFIIIGVLAVILPGLFGLTLEIIFGVLLLAGGLMQLYHAFTNEKDSGFWWMFLGGLAITIGGLILLIFPIQGLLALTLILAIFFILEGAFQIIYALHARFPNWGWLVVSGILSILIGILIWNQWPSSARWVLGLLVGINLIFLGISLFSMGRKIRAQL